MSKYTWDNLTKMGISISTPCTLCGGNMEMTAYIFLHCPVKLALWALKRNCLVVSSWLCSIAHLWGNWRIAFIPQNEVNRWDCIVNAIIWVVWHEQKGFQSQVLSYQRAWRTDHSFGESLAYLLFYSQLSPWFKVSVSAADSAGTETDRSRRLGLDSDDTRKTLHKTPKNYEKIMTNHKKSRHQNSCITCLK